MVDTMEGVIHGDTNQVTFDVPMEDTDNSRNASIVSNPGPVRFSFNNQEDFFDQVEEDDSGTTTEFSLVSEGRTFSYLALGNVSEWDQNPVAKDKSAALADAETIAQSGTMPGGAVTTLTGRDRGILIPRPLQHLYLHRLSIPSAKWQSTRSSDKPLQWELGIGSELLKSKRLGLRTHEKTIRDDPDYNRRRFADAEPHLEIVKDARFDKSLLAPKTPSLDQLIARSLSRSILQMTQVCWSLKVSSRGERRSKMLAPGTCDLRWVFLDFTKMPLRLPQDSQPHCSLGLPLRNLLHHCEYHPVLEGDVTILVRRLEALLQRMETMEFPHRKAREMFLLALINRIIRHAEPALSIKAHLPQEPRFQDILNRSKLQIEMELYGFDFAQVNSEGFCYKKYLIIDINNIRPDSHISVPYAERYLLDSGVDPAEWGIRRWGVPQRAADLVAQIAISLDGFFGSSIEHDHLIREMKNRHRGQIKAGLNLRGAVNCQRSLFGFLVEDVTSRLRPSGSTKAAIRNLPGITMQSTLVSRWLPVVSGILDAYQSGAPLWDCLLIGGKYEHQ